MSGENHAFCAVLPHRNSEHGLLIHLPSTPRLVRYRRIPMRTFRPDWMLLLTVATAVLSAALLSWL